jgi:hypothetical protein
LLSSLSLALLQSILTITWKINMTDQQLDAFLDRQIERHETWLEELNERHQNQKLEDITLTDD